MKCIFCNSELINKTTTKTIIKHNKLQETIKLQDIPILFCKNCNQKFLTIEADERLIKMKSLNSDIKLETLEWSDL